MLKTKIVHKLKTIASLFISYLLERELVGLNVEYHTIIAD